MSTRSLPEFQQKAVPERLCNYGRLLETMEARGLDGIVATSRYNVFYLSGFHPNAYHQDEPPHTAVVISRHEPDHPVVVVAEHLLAFFLLQPSWVDDIRPFRTVMTSLDLPPSQSDVDRFIPRSAMNQPWIKRARERYSTNIVEALRGAVRDLGLDNGKVGFDYPGLADLLGFSGLREVDGHGPVVFARQAKTPEEVQLIREAIQINQTSIDKTVKAWDQGMTWKELNYAYYKATVEVGGIIDDPRGLVFANPRGADPYVTLHSGLEDYVIEPGTNIIFDCHGTWNMYCWDGGKTWIVDDEPRGGTYEAAKATKVAVRELEQAMRPGVKASELQAKTRRVFKGFGVRPESVYIFFHGLGLSHSDLEQHLEEGKPHPDWALEEGMVVATHLLYPGGDRERFWAEDVVVIRSDGAESLYTWDFDPITGRGD